MWWQDAVVYQVYPRSFADGDGDGIGDLTGLRQRLDHLAWLGVDAVWLSPVFPSPMADFGYDVADYCDIDPVFGTLADADALVAEAHERGIRVLLDLVPNHTSIEHPWFTEHPERYTWRDGKGPKGDEPPNNWVRAFPWPPSLPAWTRDPRDPEGGQWYLHLFLPEQPDLDWSNPDTVAAMHDVMRFWLDRGVDGFRIDVVHCIGKDPALPDDPEDVSSIPHCALHDDPRTFPLLTGIRELLDGYDGDRMAVGEVAFVGPRATERTAEYAGPDRLHLAFDFTALHTTWDGAAWTERVRRIDAAYADGAGRWPTWAIGNHDNPRLRSRWGGASIGGDSVARAAAVLQLGLRGTPFVYAGDELGLEDATVPPDRVVDPGGRDGCRAPVPWTVAADHGWGPSPWLPFPPEPSARSVEAQRADEGSVLWLYKRLLAARKASPALRQGAMRPFDAGAGVLAWERTDAESGDRRVVLVGMTNETSVPLDGIAEGLVVDVASDGPGGEGAPITSLAPGRAVWLRPAPV